MEEFEIKEEVYGKIDYCVFCGWPINRITKKEVLKKYFEVIKEWLKKRKEEKIIKIVEGRLKNILNNELASCRYDFFDFVCKIIEGISPKLAKEFEKEFVENFDFKGAMIT